jgi:uncharacterized protein YuzE
MRCCNKKSNTSRKRTPFIIESREGAVSETQDLDENTLLERDVDGQICSITIEHAREKTDISRFSLEQVSI